jgi:pimeloyl-ACP methyl ester carboxylesterase
MNGYLRAMQQKSFMGSSPSGPHRVAYTLWGERRTQPPVICVHGLVRNGRDFDRLAETLQEDTDVYCPDVVGRGQSDWLKDPAHYAYPQYVADMMTMIATTGAKQVDWVGTSMGGLIGMILAAMPNSPIRRLVINDVGPVLPHIGLKRIGGYVGATPNFATMAEGEKYLRTLYSSFGITDDEDWKRFAAHSFRKRGDGTFTTAHDPGIAANFLAADKIPDLWDLYDKIQCPIMLLRGANSDILTSETAQEMTQRGPKALLAEFPGVGHAPALIDPTQIFLIAGFLRS